MREEIFSQEQKKELSADYPWLNCDEPYYENGVWHYLLWIEFMPIGWQKSFGLDLIKDLAEAIETDGLNSDTYKIFDVKEKYGSLRWYDTGGNAVERVIDKYEHKAEHTCVECGDEAKYISMGWICPYCENCKQKFEREGIKFVAIQNTIRKIEDADGEQMF